MTKVGLVLGGGGITGAAFQFGTLFSLRLATGWNPDSSSVVVGTSAGAFVAAVIRGNALTLDTLIGEAHERHEVAATLSNRIYPKSSLNGARRWVRRGLLPGLRRPNLGLVLGSPARFHTGGIAEWVDDAIGEEAAAGWPEQPTVIVAYHLERRERVPFGTEDAPSVPLRDAVAASAAVPFVYQPVSIDEQWYLDGGVASGTSADLVLGSPEPLDLVLVVPPMAAADRRPGALFYEGIFDRVGRDALRAELERIREEWPDTEVLVLRPDESVLAAMRPNPLAVERAIPTFLRTLRSMREELARPHIWDVLQRHLVTDRARR